MVRDLEGMGLEEWRQGVLRKRYVDGLFGMGIDLKIYAPCECSFKGILHWQLSIIR